MIVKLMELGLLKLPVCTCPCNSFVRLFSDKLTAKGFCLYIGIMNLNQLQYFLILSKTENYTKAAKLLHITQPSLSNAIANLEDELEVKLFEKTGRNVVLSKYGKGFVPFVESSLEKLHQGIVCINEQKDASNLTIRIAFLYSLSSDFIPSLISDFLCYRNDNRLKFHLYESNTTRKEGTVELIQGLKEDKFDAIFVNRVDKKDSDLQFNRILDQNYVAIVNKLSPLAEYEKLDLTSTIDIPFIQYSKRFGTRDEINSLFEEVKIKPQVYAEVEDEMSMVGLVKGVNGFAITPMKNIYSEMDIITLPISNPYHERHIYIGFRKNTYKSESLKLFIDFVKNNFQFDYRTNK